MPRGERYAITARDAMTVAIAIAPPYGGENDRTANK